MQYRYKYEVGGVTRFSHYDVLGYSTSHANDHFAKTMHYFTVFDNRPLEAIRRWARHYGEH
jgi:hypothetical protein